MEKKITWPLTGLDLNKEYGLRNPVLLQQGNRVLKLREDGKEYALKLVDFSLTRLNEFNHAMEFLSNSGYTACAKTIRGSNGQFFVQSIDKAYLLSAWQDGRKANFEEYDDLISCAKTLGQLHKQTKGYLPIGNDLGKDWQTGFCEYKQLLSSAEKCSGELQQRITYITKAGAIASDLLLKDNVHACLGQPTVLCHDNLCEKHFLIDSRNQCFLVDFSYAVADLPHSDLAQLLRRVLRRKNHDQHLALKVIAAYCHENPLSQEDFGILVAFLYFPRSLWGLGKKIFSNDPKEQIEINQTIREVYLIQEAVTQLAKDLGFK